MAVLVKELFSQDKSVVFKKVFLVALVIGISFFPPPLLIKYQLYTKAFLIIAFLIIFFQKRASIFRMNDYPLWVFLIAISVNIFFAKNKNIALKNYLDLAIPMFVIYYLVSDDFFSEEKFNLLVKIISLSGIVVSFCAILESLFAFNPLYRYFIENPYYQSYITGFVRPMSTQYNPAPLGGYLLGCLPFSYFLFKRNVSLFRLLGAVGIVLNIGVIILTFSRGAFLGLIIMAVFYLFVQRNYHSIIVLLIILPIFVLLCTYLPRPFAKFGINSIIRKGVLPVYGQSRSGKALYGIKDHDGAGLRHRKPFKDGVLSNYRMKRFNMTLRIIKDHPFVGLGFKHFTIRFYEYYPGKHKIILLGKRIADNMYFTILAETGIIGFLGFFIFVFSFLKKGWNRLKTLDYNSYQRWGLLVTLMAFIGLLLDMTGYEFFYWPNQYMLFCIVIGTLKGFLGQYE